MITILTGTVRPKTIYYVIVYYQQPHSLSRRVEQILIADQVKSNISVTFQYCPARSGCRIVLGEEDGRRFQFSKGFFTATIEHDRRTQVVGKKNFPFDYTGLACNILTDTRANLVDNLPEFWICHLVRHFDSLWSRLPSKLPNRLVCKSLFWSMIHFSG